MLPEVLNHSPDSTLLLQELWSEISLTHPLLKALYDRKVGMSNEVPSTSCLEENLSATLMRTQVKSSKVLLENLVRRNRNSIGIQTEV